MWLNILIIKRDQEGIVNYVKDFSPPGLRLRQSCVDKYYSDYDPILIGLCNS